MGIIKRIAAVHDISCYGKCSLTVAIPLLSSAGYEVVPVPTALLSAHTGINGYSFLDLSDEMKNIFTHFEKMDIPFDCVYTGFLGSTQQFDILSGFLKKTTALTVVDPVMGDNGRIYGTYTPEMCAKMSILASNADIITPNVTEAAIILGEDYTNTSRSTKEIMQWLYRLCEKGTGISVITGLEQDDEVVNFAYDSKNKVIYSEKSKKLPVNLSGTGDIFASCFIANYMRDNNISNALKKSTDFIFKCLNATVKNRKNIKDGIMFEELLREV